MFTIDADQFPANSDFPSSTFSFVLLFRNEGVKFALTTLLVSDCERSLKILTNTIELVVAPEPFVRV